MMFRAVRWIKFDFNSTRKIHAFAPVQVRTYLKYAEIKNRRSISPQSRFYSTEWDETVKEIIQDEDYAEFSERLFRLPSQSHNLIIVQPYIKIGPEKKRNTTPQLQLDEAVALVKTLPGWQVDDTALIPLRSFNKKSVFGSGNLEMLKDKIQKSKSISAVFISLNMLKAIQIVELESQFGVPVYDRYNIVIQIFRLHAVSKEAKLQVAMAEIPYLKQCLKGLPHGLEDRLGGATNYIGGLGKTDLETRRQVLSQREQKLKNAIKDLRSHRERLRSKRQGFPIVAVIGYTNAGKTSLIKALTGEEALKPRDQLFATLDVTKHAVVMPCNLKVLLVDTVGFITDIPEELIESFTATLEDAMFANLIIHIWDTSNPDYQNQRDHVWKTLKSLNVSEEILGTVIEVGNKVDKLNDEQVLEMADKIPQSLLVSTKTGFGMEDLFLELERAVIKATKRKKMTMRVKTGEKEYDWLFKQAAVAASEVDEKDLAFSLLTVVLTEEEFEIFVSKFVSKPKNKTTV